MSWIQTYTGLAFDPFQPDPKRIDIDDIAHSLAHQCRFNGATTQFYSVAQHCVEVAKRVPREYQAHALLHDASEAYLCDLPAPLKQRPEFAFYREAEARLQGAIYQRFSLAAATPPAVKLMDQRMLLLEARLLLRKCEQDWLAPDQWSITPAPHYVSWRAQPANVAKQEFINLYYLTIHSHEKDEL